MAWQRSIILICTLSLATLAFACQPRSLEGSGNIIEQERRIVPFQELSVEGPFAVEVALQASPRFLIRGDDNVLEALDIQVVGDRLSIETDRPLRIQEPIRVELATPALMAVEAHDAARVRINNVASREFSMELSNAASVEVQGEVDVLRVEGVNGAELLATELTARSAQVDLDNAATARVCARQELDATAHNGAVISYACFPVEVRREVGSGARVVAEQP